MKYVFIVGLTILGCFFMEIPQKGVLSEWVMHAVGVLLVWFTGVLTITLD